MKNLLLVLMAYLFGAVVGGVAGFNPVVSGFVAFGLSSVSVSPLGAFRTGLDVTQVTADLQNYMRFHSKEIWSAIMKGVDFEQYMRKVSGIQGDYTTTTSRRTEFLQAFQKGFQHKGGVSFHPYTNKVRRIKMDYTEQNLDELFGNYLSFLVDESKEPKDYPFVKWLVDTHIIPGMTEELRIMSVRGVYVAPTVGTAGASIASQDGVFTKITNEITAGNLTNITATGAITAVNTLDKIEEFHRSLPSEYRSMPGQIFVADTVLEDYKVGYRDQFGANQDFTGPTVKVWGTQKELVGIPQLDSSKRFLFTPSGAKGNLLCMMDKLVLPAPTVQANKRDLDIMGDFHRGWGFGTLDEVFVNDQA